MNYIAQGNDTDGLEGRNKSYHLIAGICYAKLNQPAQALKTFTAGFTIKDVGMPNYKSKSSNLLHWERGRLLMAQGDYEAAVGDLMKICINRTIKKYLSCMITR